MYGHYGIRPGECIKLTTKETGKKVIQKVNVVKEYPFFVLVEVTGRGGSYRTCINKSSVFLNEAKIARV